MVSEARLLEARRVNGLTGTQRRYLRALGQRLTVTLQVGHEGVSDAVVHQATVERGAYPSPLGYRGFPKSVCTSVNEVICHGIPDSTVLKDGDIINLDVTIYLDGVHGDTNATFLVGEVDQESKDLVQVTRECLELGIAAVKPGGTVRDIGRAIQAHAEGKGYGVVRAFVGHGIGRALHEDPQVPNFGEAGRGPLLRVGMVLALEPMVTMGHWEVRVLADRWTAVTADGSLAAHFEHTVAVTEHGPEVLTKDAGEVA